MTDFNNPLIFGKNQLARVVSCEINGGHAEVFIQNPDGSIKSEFIQNKLWLLSNENHGGFTRLKGNLFYKFGKQFDSKYQYRSTKGKLKHRGDTWSVGDFREQFLINKGVTYFKGLNPKDLSVLSFDIETTGLKHDKDSRVLIISNTFRNTKGQVSRKLFCYDDYDDEGEMIQHWVNWVKKLNPTVLAGHNVLTYDFPYLKFVAEKFGVSLDLGRDGSRLDFLPYESEFRIDGNRDQKYTNIRCYGREIIDTMFLAIRYDAVPKKYESYGLKKIIETEGLQVKDRQFYDAAEIRHNYTNPVEWEKIKRYAQHDGDDALSLFDLMIPAYFYMNQSVPKTFQQMILSASGSQLNSILVRSYLQNGHSIPNADDVERFQGAISFGNPGSFKNVFKLDVASLYPSIILQYGLYDKNKDPEGNLLKMTQFFFTERFRNKKLAKETKLEYYTNLEQAYKIFINSIYGLLGAMVNFNNLAIAAKVTEHGREILQKAIKWACNYNLKLVEIQKGKKITKEWVIDQEYINDSVTFRETNG